MDKAKVSGAQHVLGLDTQGTPKGLVIFERLEDIGESLYTEADRFFLVVEKPQTFLDIVLNESDKL
jgi:hypothetical protein